MADWRKQCSAPELRETRRDTVCTLPASSTNINAKYWTEVMVCVCVFVSVCASSLNLQHNSVRIQLTQRRVLLSGH